MRKRIVCCWAVFIFTVCLTQVVWADEISELKTKMKNIEARHQEETAELRERIETLEAARAPKIEAPNEMEERVAAIEDKLKKPYEGGLLSLRGDKWEIGGELEFEYVDIQSDAGTIDDKGHFQLDKFVLEPKAFLNDNISLVAEIEFAHSGVVMQKGYVSVAKLPNDSFFRIGLDASFIDIDRKTETHTINATAFGFRDTDLGGFYGGGKMIGAFYWRGSLCNGFQLSTKSITEDSGYPIIHEDDDINDNNQNKEVGLGLGFEHKFEGLGTVNIMSFGYLGKLSAVDIAFLQGMTGYGPSESNDEKSKIGLNFSHKLNNFTLISQYIHAVDGKLDRDGWFIQPSYKVIISNREYFNSYEFLFRYNDLDIDIDKTFSDTKTWDRQTYTFAIITDIARNLKLKTEYNVNDEDTGAGDVNNDEFLMQLEYKF